MTSNRKEKKNDKNIIWENVVISVIIIALIFPFNVFSINPQHLPAKRPGFKGELHFINDSTVNSVSDSIKVIPNDSIIKKNHSDSIATNESDSLIMSTDSINSSDDKWIEWEERNTNFSPNPTRAVWLSALFPGLGQIYNRRYWKLPIIVGGFMGLGYATSWNNGMLKDYTRAYGDIMDSDPSTNSYMDFFPNTTKEEDLDKTWLTNVLKSRKDYYRRNRDLCIICMVGVYLLAMVDAYVDASLSHFDISPDLSMDLTPTIIPNQSRLPAIGLNWALNF